MVLTVLSSPRALMISLMEFCAKAGATKIATRWQKRTPIKENFIFQVAVIIVRIILRIEIQTFQYDGLVDATKRNRFRHDIARWPAMWIFKTPNLVVRGPTNK